ncbi:uncharacterized protein LOC116351205, partial [Contarinia nasturtii]|uniref:uncharacterized protein LOC116351205 n=1 Tax=Contarinia nasturtii TaxID=265458 RepID=UPI0012D41E78
MKFVDMDVDCIESCLEHLSFDELLSAAASNKRINQAAKFIYSRKFSSKKISFSVNKGFEAQLVNRIVYFGDDSLEDHSFRDLKSSLKFLRCFGQLLTNIEILFQNDMQNDMFMFGDFPDGRNAPNKFIWTQHVIEYVNEYCAESLLDVHFYGIRDLPNYLKKPFSRVKNITLENCYFSDLVENNWLNDRFPRMQELHLNLTYSNDVGSFKFIENCFGFLEHLNISMQVFYCTDDHYRIVEPGINSFRRNILALFHLNPQLKHLEIFAADFFYKKCPFIGANDLQSVNKSLQNLESLKLNIHYQFNSGFNGDFIHFKNLK